MDGTPYIKEDIFLRSFLSHPEGTCGTPRRAKGFAFFRFSLALIDLVQVVACGTVLALVMSPARLPAAIGTASIASVLAIMVRRGIHVASNFRKATIMDIAARAAVATAIACLTPLCALALLGDWPLLVPMAPWLVGWAIVSASLSAGIRLAPVPALRRIVLRAFRPNVAVVGPQADTAVMTSFLVSQASHNVVGEFDPARWADLSRLESRAAGGEIDKVVLMCCDPADVETICFALSDTPTLVCMGFLTPTLSALAATGLHQTQASPFVPLMPSPMSDWRCILKRGMDIGLVLAFLPFIAPVLLAAAAAIKLESPGPVLFRQWRFGLGSRPVNILKFRTMHQDRGDATGEVRTRARDPRVTRVGRILRRTSIDELPQLLNVLRGEMSLVGPRPHATHMKVDGNYYFEAVEGYRMRHRVMPGITGWAQITGSRGEIDTVEKAMIRVQKDLWYVRNWSLLLDLRILAMTALGRFASPSAD